MKRLKIYIILSFLFLPFKSLCQNFLITSPKLEFDGTQLLISFDVVTKNESDQFFIWVEMTKKNGEPIRMKALAGDFGGNIKGGNNKKIAWIPSKDSVFINEEVFVEVKAEKYIKSFNKSSALILSAAFPGLGQTKISKGKPWWLAGVVSYGALAVGLVEYMYSKNTYDSYLKEENISKRYNLYTQVEKQMNTSSALYLSGAAIWAANIIWVALTPTRYEPLQHVKFSINPSTYSNKGTTLLTFKYEF